MASYLNHKNNMEEIAKAFDELTFWSSRFGHLLFDNIPFKKNIAILDIGCATGFPLFELAHSFGPSCSITGIDIWTAALDIAHQKLKVYKLNNVKIIEADACKMPFANESFDLLVSNLGVNNFSDADRAFEECYRVAKHQATISLTTNIKGHMWEFYTIFYKVLQEMERHECLERLKADEERRGSVESVTSKLKKAGFEITKVIEKSFYLRFTNGTALLHHNLVKVGFLESWINAIDIENRTLVFQNLEKRLNDVSKRENGLQMSIPMLYLEAQKIE